MSKVLFVIKSVLTLSYGNESFDKLENRVTSKGKTENVSKAEIIGLC